MPTAGSRLAGEREYAFKHVLIRDVAYSTLPKAVRARRHADVAEFISTRAADRSEGVIAMVAEHYSRAATLGAAADLEAGEMHDIRGRALEALEAAGDASAAIYSNSEAQGHYEAALALGDDLDPATVARVAEKLGDVALLLGRVDRAVRAWDQCMEYHRGEENLARVGDLHRKIGAGLWHKGDREGSIEHYQRGIDLLKDGPPCLELVRLYEEAASLYMHTGDNMLAIYASEKALRLAERLGEAGAASRAHGIFGRVFGRIGDSERARENLERSVELARETDPAEAVRALFALGYHFEVTEADYEGARETYGAALDLAVETGDLPSQVEVHAALAQIAIYRGDWEAAEHETDASQELAEREGLAGKLCYPYSMRGVLLWHDGELDESAEMLERAFEIADQVGRSEVAFESLAWLANTLRDARRLRGRRPGARAGARPLRARGPGRPIGRGDRRPRRERRRLGQGRDRREPGRGGRRPGRAPALPGRPGGEPGGQRRGRGRRRRARAPADRGPRGLGGARAAARRRALRRRCSQGSERCRRGASRLADRRLRSGPSVEARRRSDPLPRSGPATWSRSPASPSWPRPRRSSRSRSRLLVRRPDDDLRGREARRPARDPAALSEQRGTTRAGC